MVSQGHQAHQDLVAQVDTQGLAVTQVQQVLVVQAHQVFQVIAVNQVIQDLAVFQVLVVGQVFQDLAVYQAQADIQVIQVVA